MLPQNFIQQSLEALVKLIYLQYLTDSYCLTFVTKESLNAEFVSTSFTYVDPTNISYDVFTQTLLDLHDEGCSDYFIQMDNPEEFVRAIKNVTKEAISRRSDRKFVFLPTEENNTQALLDLLTLPEISYIADLLLILRQESVQCDTYDLVTHKFVGPNSESQNPVYIGSWNSCNDFVLNPAYNLFPHDISDMNGKVFTLGAFHYIPYVIMENIKNIDDFETDGTEIRILYEFCRIVNCSFEITGDNGEEWGVIFENGTSGTGTLGKIVRDEADFLVDALYLWYDTYINMDFSISTLETSVICIAPSPRILVSWALPLLPFSWTMWGLIVLTFVFGIIAFTAAQGGSTKKVVLETFGIFVGQSTSDNQGWRVRRVTGWLLIMAFLIQNAYNGGLAAQFTVPQYEKPIETIQDIIDANLEWGQSAEAWVFSIEKSEDQKIQNALKLFREYDEKTLARRSSQRDFALLIERLQGGHFAIGNFLTQEHAADLRLMKEDFYYEYCVVVARKSSPYTKKLNDLIGRLHESGLFLAWENMVVLKHLDFNVQIEIGQSRIKRNYDIGSLGFQNVVGIFIIYLLVLTVPVAVFIIEVIYGKYLKLQEI